MPYSVQPRDRIFIVMDFCVLLKISVKILVKIQVETWVVYIAWNFLIMLKNLPQMCLKVLQKIAIPKTAEETGDLIRNKIVDKITKISNTLQQNNSETFRNEHNKKKPKERYMSAEERQNIIDDLRLI